MNSAKRLQSIINERQRFKQVPQVDKRDEIGGEILKVGVKTSKKRQKNENPFGRTALMWPLPTASTRHFC